MIGHFYQYTNVTLSPVLRRRWKRSAVPLSLGSRCVRVRVYVEAPADPNLLYTSHAHTHSHACTTHTNRTHTHTRCPSIFLFHTHSRNLSFSPLSHSGGEQKHRMRQDRAHDENRRDTQVFRVSRIKPQDRVQRDEGGAGRRHQHR